MATCITCGAELHPERAEKYAYCTEPACQEQNAKGLTMLAVGVNKSADQFLLMDEHTREDMASGVFHDPRRGSYGQPDRTPGVPVPKVPAPAKPSRATHTPPRPPARRPWTRSQQNLAMLYNEQGLRPGEIAEKLRLSHYLVVQMILDGRRRHGR